MSQSLRVDPIGCTAHGLCAELLPERVALDDWGYPVIGRGEITPELAGLARRAVACCPALALRLSGDRSQPGGDSRIAPGQGASAETAP